MPWGSPRKKTTDAKGRHITLPGAKIKQEKKQTREREANAARSKHEKGKHW